MLFEKIRNVKEEDFKRLTGIKRDTFNKMIEILKNAEILKKRYGGKPNKLSMEDRLLMTFEYLSEYRTYYHVSISREIKENKAYRNIKWIEDTLIKSKEFSLPKKRELVENDNIEVILVDATETQIERTKRKQKKFTPERKNRQ